MSQETVLDTPVKPKSRKQLSPVEPVVEQEVDGSKNSKSKIQYSKKIKLNPGIVISTKSASVDNTILVPVEATNINDMGISKNSADRFCLRKGITSEFDILIDHSKAGKELSNDNRGELLASRYGNGNDINKFYHSCQLCEECDCPESPVNVEYPKLCLFCAHLGYCHDDCLKEKELGVFVPCIDYDCRQFQTDECRLCAVIKDEPEFKFDFQATSCDCIEDVIPF